MRDPSGALTCLWPPGRSTRLQFFYRPVGGTHFYSRTNMPKPVVPTAENLAPFVKLRMRVVVGGINAIGPGKIELLEAIEASKSIAAAAKSLGMSYRRAWLLVDELNQGLSSPAVAKATGGSHGGGSELTETGHQVLALYRGIERQAFEACKADMQKLLALVHGT